MELGAPPAPDDQARQYTLLVAGRLESEAAFADVILKAGANGAVTRLRDVGRVELGAVYTKSTGTLQTKAVSENTQYGFDLNGLFNLLDSTRQDMDMKINLHNTNIHLLEKYMTGIFSRLSGDATGTLEIVGGFKNLKYLGEVKLLNGGLLVEYTKCYYHIHADGENCET